MFFIVPKVMKFCIWTQALHYSTNILSLFVLLWLSFFLVIVPFSHHFFSFSVHASNSLFTVSSFSFCTLIFHFSFPGFSFLCEHILVFKTYIQTHVRTHTHRYTNTSLWIHTYTSTNHSVAEPEQRGRIRRTPPPPPPTLNFGFCIRVLENKAQIVRVSM